MNIVVEGWIDVDFCLNQLAKRTHLSDLILKQYQYNKM